MAGAKKPLVVAEFTLSKRTPGAIQYKQEAPANGSRPEIGSMYLTKTAAKDAEKIRVTVEAID